MSVWNREWKYVPAAKQGPNYLRNKFKRIQAEQKAKAEATAEKVTTLTRRKQT